MSINVTSFIASCSRDDEKRNKKKHSHVTFVNCGKSQPLAFQQILKIVDPEHGIEFRHDEQEGEIWLQSPSVAKGYWNKPELTKEIFHACLR